MKSKPDKELKQIAVDLYDNKIFCDKHIPKMNLHLISSIFLPLGLGGISKFSSEDIDDIGMIYEYLNEAGPRCINGMPIFFSLRYLNKIDTEKVMDYYDKYKKIKDEFVDEEE